MQSCFFFFYYRLLAKFRGDKRFNTFYKLQSTTSPIAHSKYSIIDTLLFNSVLSSPIPLFLPRNLDLK